MTSVQLLADHMPSSKPRFIVRWKEYSVTNESYTFGIVDLESHAKGKELVHEVVYHKTNRHITEEEAVAKLKGRLDGQ